MKIREDIYNLKQEVEEVKEQSDLIRILKMEDRKNRRLCMLIALLIVLLMMSVGYIIYLQNDIGVEEILEEDYEVEQEAGEGNNNFVNGNDNEVNNG